ncbi:hypothetical protein GN157_01620 [Flavobacterium rakeshii]|uniref:HNH nuclease domain-containing protein n=1 Tax=Flavobacterium rakeshii TaxID=1038845 RepID=A0A6N8H8Y5_9FLAO|nr:HNH endonuclease [Flavobacterium rakeshii]MEE1899219.1 HNH endonuclease [Flavobacterium rakeshii]MUV02393.1 hypothetical protein [Flavobacterium rakeshii]
MTITEKQIKIYEILKNTFEGQFSKKEGEDKLNQEVGMKLGSAKIVVSVFFKIMAGEKFTRTLKISDFNTFLYGIYKDFGVEQLKVALKAFVLHIDYSATKNDPKIALRKVIKRYEELIVNQDMVNAGEDDREQNEILSYLNKTRTKQEIVEELKGIDIKEPETVFINNKVYKRDNKIIALIKFIRNSECQICKTYIRKKDGTKYIEAAHIIPKRQKGPESPDNILLLCPNHHKEFDFGDVEIQIKTKNEIKFVMNGNLYSIDLSLN